MAKLNNRQMYLIEVCLAIKILFSQKQIRK